MSSHTPDTKKVTVPSLIAMKSRGERISALTAYDFLFASLLDQAGIDLILVGDSGSMVFGGNKNTLPLTMEEALYHCKAVSRGIERALFVTDMPFMSYQVSVEKALENAGRFFKEANVEAVKLEGGKEIAETVRRMVTCGMPVMGHLGLRPQSVHQLGGYGLQATSKVDAEKLLSDARELQDAGIFSLVLEKIPAELAKQVTETLQIPTIGIGAGPHCDGQILVTQDMLGMYETFKPKFARRYAEMGQAIRKACSEYSEDIKRSDFPSDKESF